MNRDLETRARDKALKLRAAVAREVVDTPTAKRIIDMIEQGLAMYPAVLRGPHSDLHPLAELLGAYGPRIRHIIGQPGRRDERRAA